MISWIVVLSIAVYLIFTLWDRKQIKDEREKLIELKTSEIQNKVTLYTLIALATAYLIYPTIPTWVCLIAINIANLYTEILGKLYLRFKI
ncbi:MAG: hypothetical protein ACXVCP_02420 [Bdellovibrio sp.]